ncbi:MAG: hypothetical protein KDD22_08970, partial [Bdellovibrionales bacterium]|nr:hypothetical protein [Bdellovibrionales bacterium]
TEELDPDQLQSAIDQLGGYPLVVRSSGNLEDGRVSSFAGQLDSVVGCRNWKEFLRAVEQVFKSTQTERFKSYLSHQQIPIKSFNLFVLVQRHFVHEVSGVAFTMHPLLGTEECALIELHRGSAEELVSGHISPHQAELNLLTGSVSSDKFQELNWHELRKRLLQIQAHFQHPQDIEWAWSKSEGLCFFQSRPMTAYSLRTDVEELTNADLRDGGISARPCLPLMYSLYQKAFEDGFEDYSRAIALKAFWKPQEKWMYAFYGKVYWDAARVKKYLQQIPGFDEEKFDRNLGITKSYGSKGPQRTSMSLWNILKVLPLVGLLQIEFFLQYFRVLWSRSEFFRKEHDHLHREENSSTQDSISFGLNLQKILYDQAEIETLYCRTLSNSSNAQSLFQDLLPKINALISSPAQLSTLLCGIGGISHLDSQRDLAELSLKLQMENETEVRQKAIAKFANDHYYHSPLELDLTAPRWGEEPQLVESMLKGFSLAGHFLSNPDQSVENQKHRAKKEVERIFLFLIASKASWYEQLFLKCYFLILWKRARLFLGLREEMRDRSSRAYAWLRRYL